MNFNFISKASLQSLLLSLVALSLLCIATSSYSAVWTIIYPKPEIENDERFAYQLAVLDLALQKTGVRYRLKESASIMLQAKSIKRLEENLVINVMWSMTDRQREEQLLPIRIPITRGLIGWRMFLAHKSSSFLTEPINSLDDLLKFTAVQGISWPDTKILQANGFNVETARDYVEATRIVSRKSADFFPRSVIEIFGELNNTYSTQLALRKGVVIRYPTAQYFFVSKRNITLANLIETGLRRALEDGSFEQLFNEHFGDILKSLDLDTAVTFTLNNPLLPVLTPVGDPQYWYTTPTVN